MQTSEEQFSSHTLHLQSMRRAVGVVPSAGLLLYFESANVTELDPITPQGRDIYGCGTGDNGIHYHLKGHHHSCRLALNELLLTRIANLANLATAPYRLIRHNGTYYFGSETIRGLAHPAALVRLLREGNSQPTIASTMARTLAFDILTGNEDRHYKNFLILNLGGHLHNIRVIDFSTGALQSESWKRCAPLPDQCATMRQISTVKQSIGLDVEAARDTLTRISDLPEDCVHAMRKQIPAEWSESSHFDIFCDWWREGRSISLEMADREISRHA